MPSIRDRIKKRINRARYRRELLKDERPSVKKRLKADIRRARHTDTGDTPEEIEGRRPREDQPDTVERKLARRVARGAAAAVSGAADRQPPDREDGQQATARRAYDAAQVSAPTEHRLEPLGDRGMATFQDFVSGRQPSEGIQRYRQTVDNQRRLEWVAEQSDGSVTMVRAEATGDGWEVVVSEQPPDGRGRTTERVATAQSRQHARERALDWIERNPDGMPFHAGAGNGMVRGDGFVTDLAGGGDLVHRPEGGGAAADAGGLVSADDVSFVTGGEE